MAIRRPPAVSAARITRPGFQAAMVVVLSTLLLAGTAHAYRPFDLTDADVAKRHNFEIELGPSEFVRVDSERSLRAPAFSINYGLATGRALTLEGANRVALKSTPGEPRARLEDIAFGMKQVLRRGSLQEESGPSVATEGAILFPARGETHLGAAASLIASLAGRLGSTHWNVEGERLPEGRNAGTAGLIFEASDRFGLAPAIELEVEALEGALSERAATLGLIYVPRVEVEYDLAVRVARGGDEKVVEYRAGLTWQMSAHKVLRAASAFPHPRRRRH